MGRARASPAPAVPYLGDVGCRALRDELVKGVAVVQDLAVDLRCRCVCVWVGVREQARGTALLGRWLVPRGAAPPLQCMSPSLNGRTIPFCYVRPRCSCAAPHLEVVTLPQLPRQRAQQRGLAAAGQVGWCACVGRFKGTRVGKEGDNARTTSVDACLCMAALHACAAAAALNGRPVDCPPARRRQHQGEAPGAQHARGTLDDAQRPLVSATHQALQQQGEGEARQKLRG